MASVSGHLSEAGSGNSVEEIPTDERSKGSEGLPSTTVVRRDRRDAEEGSVLLLYKTMQWLEAEMDQHKIQLEVMKNTGAVSEDGDGPNRTEELQKRLMELSTDRHIQKSMLQSVQLGQATIDFIFQSKSETTSKLQGSIAELVEQTAARVSNVLRIQKETQTQQSTLANLKEECLVLRRENRQLMYELKQLKESKAAQKTSHGGDDEIKRIQKDCNSLTDKLDLAQFCLQGLIFGSGVNWAQDQRLSDLVLSIGQPTEDALKELTIQTESNENGQLS